MAEADFFITSDFGPRGSNHHDGLDLRAEVGSKVKPPYDDMEIELVRLRDGFGLHIVLKKLFKTKDTKFIIRALYAHLSKISNWIVDLDDVKNNSDESGKLVEGGIRFKDKTVSRGDVIGETGGGNDEDSTQSINGKPFKGKSDAPHLHFEMRKESQNSNGEFHPDPLSAYYHNSKPLNPQPLLKDNIPVGYKSEDFRDDSHGEHTSDP